MVLLMHWILAALVLALIAYVFPGIYLDNFLVAMVAIGIMGLINAFVRPFVLLLTLPINILTLGLFTFIINALMFGLAAWAVPGFAVSSFFSALMGSLLLTLVSFLFAKPQTPHAV